MQNAHADFYCDSLHFLYYPSQRRQLGMTRYSRQLPSFRSRGEINTYISCWPTCIKLIRVTGSCCGKTQPTEDVVTSWIPFVRPTFDWLHCLSPRRGRQPLVSLTHTLTEREHSFSLQQANWERIFLNNNFTFWLGEIANKGLICRSGSGSTLVFWS